MTRLGSSTAAIILAAGSSTRMGAAKQLLGLDGRPLLQHVLDNVRASDVGEIILVLGASAEAIRAEIDARHERVVLNENYQEGMGTSLKVGLSSVNSKTEAALIILADQPFVRPDTLNQIAYGEENQNKSANARMDRCAKTPPFVSQPGTDGPGAWVEPGETGQDRQPQARAVETTTAPVHRATLFRAFRQNYSRQRRVYRGAMSSRRAQREARRAAKAAACEGQHLKHGERRPRYCGAAVRGADSATTRGGDVRRSCRIDVRWVEQELPPRTSGA